MEAKEILQELEGCATRLGIQVRRETGDFAGGSCRIGSQHVIILNERSSAERQAEILSRELVSLDIDRVYLLPAIRELLERAKQKREAGI